MSRIGKLPIAIPAGVEVTFNGKEITVKGSKGTMTKTIVDPIDVEIKENEIVVTRQDDEAQNRAFHGLTRALINNMVTGVSVGFVKELEIVGVGYRAQMQGSKLALNVGKSHPVEFEAPEGIQIEVPAPTKIKLTGYDKEKLGVFAAKVRAVRPPEPYKGKGIRYKGEYVRRKAGKTGAK